MITKQDLVLYRCKISDLEFSYDRQADDSMGFRSTISSPPTAFAIPEVCGITCNKLHVFGCVSSLYPLI